MTTKRWVPQGIRHQVAKKHKGICFHCKKRAATADISKRGHLRFFDENLNTYHIDHLIPRSKGGTNDISNLVLSCPTCNTGVRNKRAKNDPEVIAIIKQINTGD